MKLAISYFYQIRFFKPYMIPISTALSDPVYYRPEDNKEYYFDKRGVVCGLRYEPLVVQAEGEVGCPCPQLKKGGETCAWRKEYRRLLETVDFNKMIKAFEFCGNKFKKEIGFKEEPLIVLIVYEAPDNPCSERAALIDYFNSHGIDCKELKYPIVENY